MKRKHIIFLSLLLILFLSASAVSAADDLSTDTNCTISAADDVSADTDNLKEDITTDDLKEEEYSSVDINIDAPNILVGDDGKINASLTGEDGTVVEKDFNVTVYRINEDYSETEILSPQTITGRGTVTVPSSLLSNGTYFVNAIFAGEGPYPSWESSTSFLVKNQKETPRFETDTDGYYTSSSELYFSFRLLDEAGNSIPAYAEVYLNGTYVTTLRENLEDSFDFSCEITQKTEYEVLIIFKGDGAFNPANCTFMMHPREKRTLITIDPKIVVYGRDAQIYVTLYDDSWKIIEQPFTVTVIENSCGQSGANMTYTATGSDTVTISSDLLRNNTRYTVRAEYGGTSIYTPSSAEEEFTVLGYVPTDLTIHFDKEQYLDSDSHYYAIGNKTVLSYELLAEGSKSLEQYLDIYLNGKYFATVLTGTDGMERITVTGLEKGLNTVLVVFNGTEDYAAANRTLNITNYEKESKLVSYVPYALLGNDLRVSLTLSDGTDIIEEDFIVELYKGNKFLANYTIHGGFGSIELPSTLLNERGSYLLLSQFKGNEIYSRLYARTSFYVNDEKQEIYIGNIIYDDEINSNSTELSFNVRSNNRYVPSLVDVYLNGAYCMTVNYTQGNAEVALEGLHIGKNTVRLVINETDISKSASKTLTVNYILLDTSIYLDDYGHTESDMREGIDFYFSVSDSWWQHVRSGYADIYINGKKCATVDIAKNPYVADDDGNTHFTFRPESPGEYNVSIHYLGDETHHNPSWSENKTFTVTYYEIADNSTTVILKNTNKTSLMIAGEYLTFMLYLKSGDGYYFSDEVDIYLNGTWLTRIHSSERFNFTADVKENGVQGETIEISYSLNSNGEAILKGDEHNYIEIFLNNNRIAKTDNLTGTVSIRFNRAGSNSIAFTATSEDREYDFGNSRTYCVYQYSCVAEANPEGRVLTVLTISSNLEAPKLGDSIVIYNNLTNASLLNCPDELVVLMNSAYNWTLNQYVPTSKIKIYLNGEIVGTSNIDLYGGHPNVNFAMPTINKAGWYNITAVLDDEENVFGCTSNTLSFYIEKDTTEILATYSSLYLNVDESKDFRIYLTDSKGKLIHDEPIDIYIDGVKNATLNSTHGSFTFTALKAGDINITAVYNGSENYLSSSKTIPAHVKKWTTKVTVSTAYTEVSAGSSADITVTLKSGSRYITDSVDIYVNNIKADTINVNGTAVYRFIPQTAGTFTIYANFTGDRLYEPSQSDEITVKANRIATSLAITADETEIEAGSNTTIRVNAQSNGIAINSGLVDIYINGEKKTTLDLNGTNTYLFTANVADTFEVYAKYAENDVYSASKSNAISINAHRIATSISVSSDRQSIEIGESVVFTVNLTSKGNSLSKSVFIIADVEMIETSGVHAFTPKYASVYNVSAYYPGDDIYDGCTSDTILLSVNRKATNLIISADKTECEAGDIVNIAMNLSSGEGMMKDWVDIYANGIKNVHVYSMNKPYVAAKIQENLSAILKED